MKRLKYISEVLCDECGTGYGEAGPLRQYRDHMSLTYFYCHECYLKLENEDVEENYNDHWDDKAEEEIKDEEAYRRSVNDKED